MTVGKCRASKSTGIEEGRKGEKEEESKPPSTKKRREEKGDSNYFSVN